MSIEFGRHERFVSQMLAAGNAHSGCGITRQILDLTFRYERCHFGNSLEGHDPRTGCDGAVVDLYQPTAQSPAASFAPGGDRSFAIWIAGAHQRSPARFVALASASRSDIQ